MDIRLRSFVILSAFALFACGSESDNAANEAGAPEALPSEAELARDAELANEAAADEAADMNNFGGSAAEMDFFNAQ